MLASFKLAWECKRNPEGPCPRGLLASCGKRSAEAVAPLSIMLTLPTIHGEYDAKKLPERLQGHWTPQQVQLRLASTTLSMLCQHSKTIDALSSSVRLLFQTSIEEFRVSTAQATTGAEHEETPVKRRPAHASSDPLDQLPAANPAADDDESDSDESGSGSAMEGLESQLEALLGDPGVGAGRALSELFEDVEDNVKEMCAIMCPHCFSIDAVKKGIESADPAEGQVTRNPVIKHLARYRMFQELLKAAKSKVSTALNFEHLMESKANVISDMDAFAATLESHAKSWSNDSNSPQSKLTLWESLSMYVQHSAQIAIELNLVRAQPASAVEEVSGFLKIVHDH